MGVINVRNNKLVLQFRYLGNRCREQTQLPDTPANQKRLQNLLKRIEAEIIIGTFKYSSYFPKSNNAIKFSALDEQKQTAKEYFDSPDSPMFEQFAETWLAEKQVEWRIGHYTDVEGALNNHILPKFGKKKISVITKQDILSFRTALAKVQGRKGKVLSPSRINHIMTPLRMILNEAADRYEFTSPWRNIKALKVPRTEVDPFNFQEVEQVIKAAPEEFKNYYIVRFFTGLRSSEIDGLTWKQVDLEAKRLTVSQSLVRGVVGSLKTDSSFRTIDLPTRVVDALKKQKQNRVSKQPFVFTNQKGLPLNYQVVSRSVWYPMLERAGLKPRNPYQTRHTYATLLLAAGESPEWIANQMGHTTTTMLFRVYSRYVPNLMRRDGTAFEALLQAEEL
ncbi:site-specific integrase [Vibrio hibernica]|uniref:site-specific integrase n=1 Tax=Vibrio hibernica TaxID=2587465 RepID=UPI0018823E3C|nr:site-specific integrase [Vibrio hibernica]